LESWFLKKPDHVKWRRLPPSASFRKDILRDGAHLNSPRKVTPLLITIQKWRGEPLGAGEYIRALKKNLHFGIFEDIKKSISAQ
jgi:hypothetical protein